MATTFTPYTTAKDLFGSKPQWVPLILDQERLQAYTAYEEIYWNVPDTFKVSLRGTNTLPVYVPSGRTIVDTTSRFTATGFAVATRDRVSGAASPDSQAALLAIQDLMKREKFRSKFNANKRYGIIRGDSIWHVTADPEKPIGTRLTLTSLDPGMYFPITDENDVDKILGCHLVENIETADGPRIRRLTYMKDPDSGRIIVSEGLFAIDDWGRPDSAMRVVIRPPEELPPSITSVPVYHTKNFEEPGNPFGSSELRGLERIMGAVNQTMSDEDLALALEGIGMYATDGSRPTNDKGEFIPYLLGPGRVVHTDGTFWQRVQGVSNLGDSYGAHYERLWEALKQASGTPDIAIGRVDVTVAESGIALALQLGPMLAKASEKNDLIVDTHTHMFFDIVNGWIPAYEQTTFTDVGIECVVGDPVPVDRAARFTELNDMLDRGVIDTEYYRQECVKLGYAFPADIAGRAEREFAARNQDQFAARVNEEAGDEEAGDDGES